MAPHDQIPDVNRHLSSTVRRRRERLELTLIRSLALFAIACGGREPTAAPEAGPSVTEPSTPQPSAGLVFSGTAGPDHAGDMDQHQLSIDLAAGRCRFEDQYEGETIAFDGACRRERESPPWLVVGLEGEIVKRTGEGETRTAPRPLEVAWFRDLPAAEQALYLDAEEGETEEQRGRMADCLVLSGTRIYCGWYHGAP